MWNFWVTEAKPITWFKYMMWGKKLIPVTTRIYWHPSVCKIKTRELGIPDNWSATVCNSVSQGKWRGGAGGKVRAELMNNSHCALNCCWVKNKLYYVKGNWRTHHRNDSVLLTPTLFQHAKCMQNGFFPLLSKFFYGSQNNRTIFSTSWYHNQTAFSVKISCFLHNFKEKT